MGTLEIGYGAHLALDQEGYDARRDGESQQRELLLYQPTHGWPGSRRYTAEGPIVQQQQ